MLATAVRVATGAGRRGSRLGRDRAGQAHALQAATQKPTPKPSPHTPLHPAYGPPRTPAMPIPSPSGTPVALAPLSPRPVEATSPALTPATPPPSATADVASTKLGARRGRRGGGKIDGLDYYEYVELIRASSL